MPETLAERLTFIMELPASGSLDHTLTGQVAGRVIIEIYPEIAQIRGRPLCCVYRAASHLLFFSLSAVSLPFGRLSLLPTLVSSNLFVSILVSLLALLLCWSVFPFLPAPSEAVRVRD